MSGLESPLFAFADKFDAGVSQLCSGCRCSPEWRALAVMWILDVCHEIGTLGRHEQCRVDAARRQTALHWEQALEIRQQLTLRMASAREASDVSHSPTLTFARCLILHSPEIIDDPVSTM